MDKGLNDLLNKSTQGPALTWINCCICLDDSLQAPSRLLCGRFTRFTSSTSAVFPRRRFASCRATAACPYLTNVVKVESRQGQPDQGEQRMKIGKQQAT